MGADTTLAVGTREIKASKESGFCGRGHCCGSGEKLKRLLREQTLLQQWGNIERAPAGADTAVALGKYR